ncbi:hypothetical protein [uncultured Paenibacillus sp.]|nr:hypothetical protein [uncultured Paenibacillus sp.]
MSKISENIKLFSKNHFETKGKSTVLQMQIHTTDKRESDGTKK